MIAVFGAGAIGCWVGGTLASGGADVTLVGRARVMDELAQGLTISELDGPTRTVAITTATDPAAAAAAAVRASCSTRCCCGIRASCSMPTARR